LFLIFDIFFHLPSGLPSGYFNLSSVLFYFVLSSVVAVNRNTIRLHNENELQGSPLEDLRAHVRGRVDFIGKSRDLNEEDLLDIIEDLTVVLR